MQREFPGKIEPNETPEEYVRGRLENINARKGYDFAQANPTYPIVQRDQDIAEISRLCSEIEDVLPRVEELIKEVFSSVESITEQTKLAAIYLLVGKAYKSLRAALLLCRNGHSVEAMEVSRSGKEAIELAILFWDDANAKHLTKWFKGDIVENGIAREYQHELLNRELAEHFGGEEQPIRDILRKGYRTMSVYTHSAYSGLLDNVDVFNFDFDFKKYGGYHYCIDNFHVVEDLLIKILLQLKNCAAQLGDAELYAAVDELSKHYDVALTQDQLHAVLAKYKKPKDDGTV